ncbi:hypothetical protein ACFX12_014001 [Malus domestica]
MNEFDLCINNANLVDLVFTGVQFTWCNKRDNGSIAKKLDRFFNFLADREDFFSIVHDAWHSSVRGTFQYQVCYKLKMVKHKLKRLNHCHVQDVTIKAKEAKHALDCCQRDLDDNVFDLQLREQEKLLLKSYSDAILAEESFFKQKARVQWLKSGDRNSSYFFKVLNNLIKNPLSCEMVNPLCCEVTRDEIKDVCFFMNPNKAPGPDGFNGMFFRKAWPVIGGDIIRAVKEFFSSGKLLKEFNTTIITLVPKVPNPSTMGDFRPISCCNTMYKIISKVLANRLKSILPHIISKSQTAFVHGRRIGDNILLVQELLRNYHRDTGSPRCALKVDLMKAYDMVEWDFILSTLMAFNFPPIMINWIHCCISSPKFSISVNGELTRFFASKRGLRQRDPLSPYLFIIAMEIKIPQNCLWNWRKLFRLRDFVWLFFFHKIGDGRGTSLWYDNWHPLGPLVINWSSHIIAESGLPKTALVCNIWNGSNWCWPNNSSHELEIQISMSNIVPNRSLGDMIRWTPSSSGIYSAASA